MLLKIGIATELGSNTNFQEHLCYKFDFTEILENLYFPRIFCICFCFRDRRFQSIVLKCTYIYIFLCKIMYVFILSI